MKFCKLEKDDITFDDCKLFIEMFLSAGKIKLMMVGNIIQKRKLEDHLKNNCIKEECSQEESLKWLHKNAVPLRLYLDSLVIFSHGLFTDICINYRKGLVRIIFNSYIDNWNEHWETLNLARFEEKL